MIHADLQHHTHSAEDRFTSNCLGLLCLLPDKDFIDFLSHAVNGKNACIPLSQYTKMSTIDFWPWLPPEGFPDVITALQGKDGSEPLTLIIEVKHGAPKSTVAGTTDADKTLESSDSTEDDRRPGDQLARYWRAGLKHFQPQSPESLAVIYLMHHRSLREADIEKSLCEAGPEARIFWLSWFDLYRWTSNQLKINKVRAESEVRILKTLHTYLTANEYRCFLGWSSLPTRKACRLDLNHTCDLDQMTVPAKPLGFYQTNQEEL
jgi:hypothetical protein